MNNGCHQVAIGSVLLFVLILALPAWVIFDHNRSYRWSQDITAVIEVDGQSYRGSSLSRIDWEKHLVVDLAFGYIGRPYQHRIRAEAGVIELPGRNPLFLLLQSHYVSNQTKKLTIAGNNRTYLYSELAVKTFLPKLKFYESRTQVEELRGIVKYKGETKAIPTEFWPTFVYFDDLADPMTMHVITNDTELSAALGTPAHIQSVTLTLADDQPTLGKVLTYLPWLAALQAEAAEATAGMTAFAAHPGELERQIQPSHFLVDICFGTSQPCKTAE